MSNDQHHSRTGALLGLLAAGIAAGAPLLAVVAGWILKTQPEAAASVIACAPIVALGGLFGLTWLAGRRQQFSGSNLDATSSTLSPPDFAELEALRVKVHALNRQLSDFSRARDDAEAANQAKTQFLAMMSHELRTPLNAILGFSEIIRSEALGPVGCEEYQSYASDIYTSGAHLLSVINDLLDLAKVESGMVDLRDELVDPSIIVDETVRIVSKTQAAKDIAIIAEPEAGIPKFRGDRRRLRQILLNLASNAAKFTSEGGSVRVRAYLDTDGGIVLETIDTGIGIPADDLERVLEPFVQLDNQLTREYHGTGLGLPLCKQLAELHGGRFEIESVVNQGTTVRVSLPAARTIQQPSRKTGATAAA